MIGEKRNIVIHDSNGLEIFRQDNVEVPVEWSETAVNIFVSKYFYGKQGTSERETSIFQVINRVVDTIAYWGFEDKYFESEKEKEEFIKELKDIFINQKASMNSPTWFNIGAPGKQVACACFILDVEDNMVSILDWIRTEAIIFNSGSGAGINVSTLRSSKENLSSGGLSSGPISFMRAADSMASVIKSGGKVRRAAKLLILEDSHPDLIDFIECKINSEEQMRVLRDAGLSKNLDDDHLGVPFQNSNHSVRLSNKFMEAVLNDNDWNTYYIKDGTLADTYRAKDVLRKISDAIYKCADPGIAFSDNINDWNTVKKSGMILASNPCFELQFLNNSACNLASIKLTAFFDTITQKFNIREFQKTVNTLITAQDILVGRSEYPTEKIKNNSMAFRPLGLGYTDLGDLLMRMGYSYDSDEGRNISASIASLMTAMAYKRSSELAILNGAFENFDENYYSMFGVIKKHQNAASKLTYDQYGITKEAVNIWIDIVANAHSFRNAQVTLMAPCGTIGLAMDCTTLGIEPEFSLIKYKKMSGGGHLKFINQSVSTILTSLGYSFDQINQIMDYIIKNETIEGSCIEESHLSIFDCAIPSKENGRFLSPESHLKMLSAVQPHISGGISKTCNLPNNITVEEIEDLIIKAWKWGLKGLTFYRDGCKVYQPLTVKREEVKKEQEVCPIRKKLPVDCNSKRHKFRIGEIEGYLHCGLYEDGSLGEVFITISKEGSTIAGLMDTIATLTSIALQYGVPLDDLVNKFSFVRFEPSGFTDNPNIRSAKSVVDYLFRYLGDNFNTNCEKGGMLLSEEVASELNKGIVFVRDELDSIYTATEKSKFTYSAPICKGCGSILVRSGNCYVCGTCGMTTGCS